MKLLATAFLLAGISCAQLAPAMTLSPRGTGQLLEFAYYTVNKQQQTLVMVSNTTAHAKVLQVRFHEAYNGRDVLEFRVFLPAHDAWTGTVFSLQDAGLTGSGAAILVDDKSCTLPDISVVSPKLADGRSYQPFLNYAYTGSNADTGPADDARTREGFLEIMEMAEVTGATLAAITPVNGVPANCSALSVDLPSTDFSPPGGGLAGTQAIVNVAQGTFFSANAYAIDGFTNRTLLFPLGSLHPDLSDASPSANGFVSAYIPVGDRYIQLDYPPSQAIDAVSAVLMSAQVFSEWDNSPSEGAQTDLVITLPTKHYYTDRSQTSNAIAPFAELFGGQSAGRSYATFSDTLSDRTGAVLGTFPMPCPWECPPAPAAVLAYETQVMTFSRDVHSDVSEVLGSRLALSMWPTAAFVGAGTVSMDVATSVYGHQLRPDAHGVVVRGLPLIGFTATNYINGNVTPGVLANYSSANALRTSLGCDAVVVPDGASALCGGQ